MCCRHTRRLLKPLDDGSRRSPRIQRATEVSGRATGGQGAFYRGADARGVGGGAQPVEHHRGAENRADWVGDPFAGDVRRAAMDRIKK